MDDVALLRAALAVALAPSPAAALAALAAHLGLDPARDRLCAPGPDEVALVWPEGAAPPGDDALRLALPEGGVLRVAWAAAPPPPAWAPILEAWAALRRRAAEEERWRRRVEEAEALHTLGLAVHRSLDPDEVLPLVARFAATLLGAHYVVVRAEESGGAPAAAVDTRSPPPPRDPLAEAASAAGRPLVRRAAELPPDSPHHAEGAQTVLAVPLVLFGQRLGALVVGYRRPYEPTPQDLRLALTLAGHAAVALSNARLHRSLERAYAELREAAQQKERFFAAVSHELRTPLNAILGFQSLLLEGIAGPLTEPQRAYLERAQRATRTLLELVNDVLDLAKLEAGKLDISLSPTPLGPVVREVLGLLQPLADAKGLRLRGPEGALPTIVTDPQRLRQILVNLVANAVKFTDAGEVALSVAEDEATVTLAVRDTGPGIAPEDRERIFQEFEQVAGASQRGGTGLGLPIARRLARRLGGDLVVDSEVGRGSTFRLWLPKAGPPAEAVVGARAAGHGNP